MNDGNSGPITRATAVVVNAPIINWPSPPTFISPARAGTIVANAASRYGAARTNVSCQPYDVNTTADTIEPYVAIGFTPASSMNRPKMTSGANTKPTMVSGCRKLSAPSLGAGTVGAVVAIG